MGYVSENLLPGEQVIRQAAVHWFVFVPGAVLLVIAFLLRDAPPILPVMFVSLGIFFLIRAAIIQTTTELAITTQRVIAKTGLISRKTMELNLPKVESLTVNQSVFGRMLDFGTVVVSGTGGNKTPIPSIIQPLEFRRIVMQQSK